MRIALLTVVAAFGLSACTNTQEPMNVGFGDAYHHNIAVQVIDFPPQSQSSWHTHPGPVFISVISGSITFYDEDCQPIVRNAGEGFLDTGVSRHMARNEDLSVPARNVVTYFAPAGAPLRSDQPAPDCAF